VATVLSRTVRAEGQAEMQACDSRALGQAVKSITIARDLLASSGVDLVCRPALAQGGFPGGQRTAVTLSIELEQLSPVIVAVA